MIVFTVFFGRNASIDTGGVPYTIFVYVGLVFGPSFRKLFRVQVTAW